METKEGIENITYFRVRNDGSELWLLTSKVPLENDTYEVIGDDRYFPGHRRPEKMCERSKNHFKISGNKAAVNRDRKMKIVSRLTVGVAHKVKNPKKASTKAEEDATQPN